MGPGLTALLVFIALIIIWAVVLKRNIVEAAILSLIILPFFGGVDQAPGLMAGAIKYVLNYEVLYASLAFIVMAFLLQHSNVLDGMLHIFTRLFGRMKGGPAYVNTAISSALGCMSGGNTPNAATAGAFTAEWLLKSGWNREQAATLIAANGGLGQVDFVLLDEEGRIVPMRERRPPAGRPPKNSAQRVIQRRQKKGRYRPPKRNRKGKLR